MELRRVSKETLISMIFNIIIGENMRFPQLLLINHPHFNSLVYCGYRKFRPPAMIKLFLIVLCVSSIGVDHPTSRFFVGLLSDDAKVHFFCQKKVCSYPFKIKYLLAHEFSLMGSLFLEHAFYTDNCKHMNLQRENARKDSFRCGCIDRGVCGVMCIYPALALPRPIVVPPDSPSAKLGFLDMGPNVEKWVV